jgi:hypothetical protein
MVTYLKSVITASVFLYNLALPCYGQRVESSKERVSNFLAFFKDFTPPLDTPVLQFRLDWLMKDGQKSEEFCIDLRNYHYSYISVLPRLNNLGSVDDRSFESASIGYYSSYNGTECFVITSKDQEVLRIKGIDSASSLVYALPYIKSYLLSPKLDDVLSKKVRSVSDRILTQTEAITLRNRNGAALVNLLSELDALGGNKMVDYAITPHLVTKIGCSTQFFDQDDDSVWDSVTTTDANGNLIASASAKFIPHLRFHIETPPDGYKISIATSSEKSELKRKVWDKESFGLSVNKVSDGIFIDEVLENSRADQIGFKRGMVITAVNNIPAKEMGLSEFAEFMRNKVVSSIAVKGGSVFKIEPVR